MFTGGVQPDNGVTSPWSNHVYFGIVAMPLMSILEVEGFFLDTNSKWCPSLQSEITYAILLKKYGNPFSVIFLIRTPIFQWYVVWTKVGRVYGNEPG